MDAFSANVFPNCLIFVPNYFNQKNDFLEVCKCNKVLWIFMEVHLICSPFRNISRTRSENR